MFNKNMIFNIMFFCLLCNFAFAGNEPVAGEMLKKEKTTPYFEIEPKRNLTDVLPSTQNIQE